MDALELLQDATVLSLTPGDTIVVRVKYPIAAEMAASIECAFRAKLTPEIRDNIGVIVVDSSAEIGVLRKTADAAS